MQKLVLAGKFVGEIDGKVFYTKRGKEHFFRKFNGFGLSDAVVNELLERGVEEIEFDYFDAEQGRIAYRVRLAMFIAFEQEWSNVERGQIDVQHVCNVNDMVCASETIPAIQQ